MRLENKSEAGMRIKKSIVSAAVALIFLFGPMPGLHSGAAAAEIDPDGSGRHFAYGENIGWISFKPDRGPGVTIEEDAVSGFVWSETAGWINLNPANCDDCGVANDGKGNLFGWAWGQLVGWISLSCVNTGSCDQIRYGVSIDPETGQFSGQAWGENIGWINFDTAQFGVASDWQIEPGAGVGGDTNTGGDGDNSDAGTDGRSGGGSGGCYIDSLTH